VIVSHSPTLPRHPHRLLRSPQPVPEEAREQGPSSLLSTLSSSEQAVRFASQSADSDNRDSQRLDIFFSGSQRSHYESGSETTAEQEAAGPLTFLIVDDSSASRKMLRRLLSLDKALPPEVDILEADDGETGVEAMKEAIACGQHIDCVFLDFTMIRMHGPEAAMIMRQQLGYKGLIVSVTGNVLPADQQRLLDSGVDRVLPKPMPVGALAQILTEYRLI
jgi:CheY-like chemotaxis protein